MPETNDQDSRDLAAKELRQSLIVDAGAGTGKTTVLISRILGAVITGKSDLEHIVAITFTEKASGELKVRLRFELEDALGRHDGEEWSRVRRALADIERAQVTTIHSFCAALLRERPFEAMVKPDFEVLDELGAGLVMDRTWESWLAEEMEKAPPVLLDLLRSGINLDEMKALARVLLDHRDILEPAPSPVNESLEDFLRLLKASVGDLVRLGASCIDHQDHAFIQIQSLKSDLEKWTGEEKESERDLLLAAFSARANVGNQKNWRPKEHLTEVRALLGKIQEGKETLASAIRHNRAAALLQWLKGYTHRYDQEKRASGSLDFFDLLYLCRELLKNNRRVRGYFQQRFDYILVDEFQDTDPLQIEILFFLAEKRPQAESWQQVELRPGKLFLVGDPKQSIYRFRRADIEAYHEARELVARQGQVLRLSMNFRSRPGVVDWVNNLFSRLIRPPEEGAYQPPYQPIQAARTGGQEPSVWMLPLASQFPIENGAANALRMAEARTVAAFLKKIVVEGWTVPDPRGGGKRGISYGDIGILFRAKEAIDLYEEEFRDFEIPYRVAGGRRYYTRLEMNALLALLTCLDNPKDPVALTATLRSPFFGVSDEELFITVQEGFPLDFMALSYDQSNLPKSVREAAARLRELHAARNEVSVSRFLLEIFELTRILSLLYLKPQGDQKVANLFKLVDLAHGLEGRGIITLRSFVRFLNKMEAAEAEEGESPLAEESEDAVRLMTIHKAKGLEFPLVILGDAAYEGRHRVSRGAVNRRQGRLEIRLGSQERAIMTQGWEQTAEQERVREEAEDFRLLYVAATRARDYLVLPFPPGDRKKRFLGPLWEGLGISQEAPWGKEISSLDDSSRSVMVFDSRTLDTEKRELRPFRANLDFKQPQTARKKDPSYAQYRSWERRRREILVEGGLGRKVLSATALAKPEDEVIRGSGLGVSFGSFVHDMLRMIDFRHPEELRALALSLGLNAGLEESVIERGVKLVEWGLTSPPIRRAMRSPHIWRELPFVYRHHDHLIEGFIDLVFEENGEIVVVDYKTDVIRDERDLAEKIRLYRPQGMVYGAALQRITGKKVNGVIFLFLSAKAERSISLGKRPIQGIERLLRQADVSSSAPHFPRLRMTEKISSY